MYLNIFFFYVLILVGTSRILRSPLHPEQESEEEKTEWQLRPPHPEQRPE